MKTAVVAAYQNFGCEGLCALVRAGIEIRAVFTYADDPAENTWFESVAQTAAGLGIPAYAPDDINHPLWLDRIRALEPDFLFSFFYRDLLCKELLDIPKVAALNLHASLLPRYRGRAPINWVLVNGEQRTGVTLHHMTPRADDGDIVCQAALDIDRRDTAATLNRRLVRLAAGMLDDCLPGLIAGTAARSPQDHSQATTFGRRGPGDGAIDWRQSATAVCNLVRAVTLPYPGAFTARSGTTITVWDAVEVARGNGPGAAPGTVTALSPLTVSCGRGAVQIRAAQAAGGLFCNGERLAEELELSVGTRLGKSRERRVR
ncbi:MAG TPA: formyltransferase family protein, partial [Woeseiaceae bacterium]|nr:formyltransferase family protein [Woeseiaceae bacterium]